MDGFVGANSTQFFIVPHDKLIYNNGLTNIPVGHIFPYKCTEHLHACICTEVKKAVIALGLKNCFFNMDILVSASQAFVIELGARTGATCIPELLSKYCGFDFYEKILLVSLGYQTSFSFSGSGYCAAKLLCASYSGKITSISTPDISNYENCEISLDYSVGESVLKFMNGSNRIGHIIACAPNLSLVLEKLSLLEEQVHIEISQ